MTIYMYVSYMTTSAQAPSKNTRYIVPAILDIKDVTYYSSRASTSRGPSLQPLPEMPTVFRLDNQYKYMYR